MNLSAMYPGGIAKTEGPGDGLTWRGHLGLALSYRGHPFGKLRRGAATRDFETWDHRALLSHDLRSMETHGVRKGLTLVELLATISTLALLLALLMPALAGARSQARGLACRSNLRQLLLAGAGYATENDGFHVPAARDMWNNAGLHRWHGVRRSISEPFDPSKGPLAAYLAEGQIKECPERVEFVRSSDWNTSFERGCGGYGYNMAYIGSRLWDPGMTGPQAFQQAYARTTALGEIRSPGRTVIFADTAIANSNDSLIEYSFVEPPFIVYAGQVMRDFLASPSIHFRHGNCANIGWGDNHVSSEPAADCDAANAYGVHSATVKLGWFSPTDNSPFDLK